MILKKDVEDENSNNQIIFGEQTFRHKNDVCFGTENKRARKVLFLVFLVSGFRFWTLLNSVAAAVVRVRGFLRARIAPWRTQAGLPV